MIVALRWYGPERSDLEIVGPFPAFDVAHAWGEPRGFRITQLVLTPKQHEAYSYMLNRSDD